MKSFNKLYLGVGLTKLVSAFLLASTFTLLFISCSKDEIKTQLIANHDAKYDMYYRLVSFIETMDGKNPSNPAILPRSEYSAGDVILYVEGGMNLAYTDPELTWKDYEYRTDTFTIPLTSGYASEQNVEDLFEKVRDTASVHFYSISEADRFPFLYDVVNISNSTTLLTLSVLSMVGKIHRDPTPFGELDYWSIFLREGLCDPSDDPSDHNASSILNDELDDYFRPYGCGVWTQITMVFVENLEEFGWEAINENDPNPGDFIIDYRTLYTICEIGTSECSEFVDNGIYCLAPDEMNYYFQSIVEICNDYTHDSGLDFRMSGFEIHTSEGTYYITQWKGSITFGIRSDCIEGGDFPYVLPFCCS